MSFSLKRNLAERSLEWRDEDKVSFLWGEYLVIAYVNRDYKTWYALTDLAPEDIRDINMWLGSYLDQNLDDNDDDERADI